MATDTLVAVGRRKTAVARVRLSPGGDGTVRINGRTMEDYFPRDTLRAAVLRPLMLTEKLRDFNVDTLVDGGGIAAQAGAISHGIARCLLLVDVAMRGTLKKDGRLTRDPRMKERKKYGQKGARKRFQFSKR